MHGLWCMGVFGAYGDLNMSSPPSFFMCDIDTKKCHVNDDEGNLPAVLEMFGTMQLMLLALTTVDMDDVILVHD